MQTSRHKGVYKTVNKKPYGTYEYWIANIKIDGVLHLRRCATEEQAVGAYKRMCKELGYVEPIKFD